MPMTITAAVFVSLWAANLSSQESKSPADPAPPAPFAELKALEGTWTGTATWDLGGKKSTGEFALVYRVTSGGNVVEETMVPGTPGEMVSIYHLDGGGVVATHYCRTGRHPRFTLEPSANPRQLSFKCMGGINMTEKDSHMHAVRLTIVDADHLSGYWNSVKDGKLQWEATADLVRKAPASAR